MTTDWLCTLALGKQLHAQLYNSHVIQVKSVKPVGGLCFTEFEEVGKSLQEYIDERNKAKILLALRCVYNAVDTLLYDDIEHGNISPRCIFETKDGHFVVGGYSNAILPGKKRRDIHAVIELAEKLGFTRDEIDEEPSARNLRGMMPETEHSIIGRGGFGYVYKSSRLSDQCFKVIEVVEDGGTDLRTVTNGGYHEVMIHLILYLAGAPVIPVKKVIFSPGPAYLYMPVLRPFIPKEDNFKQGLMILKALKDNRCVHMDIKKSNMYTDETRKKVYLGDFGISIMMGDDARFTDIPPYFPPEAIYRDERYYNHDWDMYMMAQVYGNHPELMNPNPPRPPVEEVIRDYT